MTADMSEHELEALLVAAASDTAARPAFAQALLASKVYVLGSVDGQVEGETVSAGSKLVLAHLAGTDGPVIPFFTSEEMLTATLAAVPGLDPRFLRMTCRDLWSATPGARYVLNPHGQYGKAYEPPEIDALLAGREPGVQTHTVTEEQRVLVGRPAHVPDQLPMVLAKFFSARPAVAAARLGWIAHPDGSAGYLVTVAAADRESAMAGFGSIGIGEFTAGNTIDVVVEPDAEPPRLLASIEPFYERASGGAHDSQRRRLFKRR